PATPGSTWTREHAEHFCPERPKAERAMPVAARSRSALRVTIAAFFPPISAMQGRGQAPEAKRRAIDMPTSYEPVNVIPATPGDSTSAAPTVAPLPLTEFTTPAGMPAP